jgi:hypothetical protein
MREEPHCQGDVALAASRGGKTSSDTGVRCVRVYVMPTHLLERLSFLLVRKLQLFDEPEPQQLKLPVQRTAHPMNE